MAEPSSDNAQMDASAPQTNGAADAGSSSGTDESTTLNKHQPAADLPPSDRPDSPEAAAFTRPNAGSQDAPATPDVLHENGNGVSATVEDGSAEGDGASDPTPVADEPWTKRLYFVRMPKPQEDNQYAAKVLQEEIDVYKNQVQLLNESFNVVKMQRDSTKNSVQEARENFNAANEAFQAKQQEVQPLQQGRKTQSDAQRSFQQEYRDLEVRSEAELDAKIKAVEYHMSHESMPIAEERQMVKHIKKLRDQRPRVRQYEAQFADVEEARAAASSNRGELKELQQERQVLFEDKQLQQTILNKHRDELRALDEKMNEIKEERSRVKEQQDGVYYRLRGLQQQSRGKKDAYYQNRRFSQEIRKLLKEGKLEQAKEMCEEQTTAALGYLHENEAWRQEYLELWSHQRPPPFRVGFDDYDFDNVTNDSSTGQKAGGKGRATPTVPALSGKEKAQAIIAAALAEVKQDLSRKANNNAADSVPGAGPSLGQASEAPAQPPAAEKAAVKPPKAIKASKAPKAVELPPEAFQREEAFAPPPVVQKQAADKQADAEVVRQQQARLQEENQRRKEKAAERKQKAAQKRKAQAAEQKAQEATAKAEASAQQQKPQPAPPSDAEAEDSESSPAADSLTAATTSVSNSAAAVAEKATAAVRSAPAQAKKAVSKAAKQAEALKRKLGTPKARGVRKKGWKAEAMQYVRSAKQYSLAHPAELGLVGVVAVMLCMVYVLVSSRSSPQPVS